MYRILPIFIFFVPCSSSSFSYFPFSELLYIIKIGIDENLEDTLIL